LALDTLSPSDPLCVGIIGGGQLGKMIAHEAKRMSLKVVILDPTKDCPASSFADDQIVADFKDENAIRKLSSMSDIVTYEIELANSAALKELESQKYPIFPLPHVLKIVQNKYRQKLFLRENGIPVPEFALVTSESQLEGLCEEYGYPAMLKACEDSYDGRGNFIIASKDDISRSLQYFAGKECMLEKFVAFSKEISIMVARNIQGQIESFPVAENIHRNSILDTTIVPARISSSVQGQAKRIATKTASAFGSPGIFGVEMFVTRDNKVMVNEIAPRPHNSGHYANEACSISQFEQHLRAVMGLPLVKPELLSPAVMVNILGPDGIDGPYNIQGVSKICAVPGVKLYIYGKKISKYRRKLGHITATASSLGKAIERAKAAREMIKVDRAIGGR